MARKPKERKIPIINKEYVWELEVNDEIHYFKVFVGEDECITYEDDVECKHLKIMDKRQKEGLLQIDCETKVFDGVSPFQLENGIPYLKLENDEGELRWLVSDTTREDRLAERVKTLKKEAYVYAILGVTLLLITLVLALTNNLGEWPIWPIMGIFFLCAAAMQMVRLKNELEAMGRSFSLKL